MPELPEVETVVRDLNKKVIGQTITAVWCDWPKMIRVNPAAAFARGLIGEKILGARRKGKNILIELTGGKILLIHQKMTGHLLIGQWDIKKHYIHLILTLQDGRMLALSDVRKFAKVILGRQEQIENLIDIAALGPDALDPLLKLSQFTSLIRAHGRKIKQVLMDPQVIAGIGNIYGDDLLWQAKVHPEKRANILKPAELKLIYMAMRRVLTKAVRLRGTSTSDFRDTAGKEGGYTGHLLVYRRTGKPCHRCSTPIKRTVIASRSAHFCPSCQSAPKQI